MDEIVCGPIVEMLGDGMAAQIWDHVKDSLIFPFVDIKLEVYDLTIRNRDKTDNQVIYNACKALKENCVGVKCATKCADARYAEILKLKNESVSANILVRRELRGTIIREPMMFENFHSLVRFWDKPFTIIHLGEFDIYDGIDFDVKEPGKLELEFTPDAAGEVITKTVYDFKSKGIVHLRFITDEAIRNFAHTSFRYALWKKVTLILSTLSKILNIYDGRFRTIFNQLYVEYYQSKFEDSNISYVCEEIDRFQNLVKLMEKGNFAWSMQMYFADIFSCMAHSAFGLMSSTFVCDDGRTIYLETCHGTPSKMDKFLRGSIPGFNPPDTITAWARALKHRAKIDNNCNLYKFSNALEASNIQAIESGIITQDLTDYVDDVTSYTVVRDVDFIDAVQEILEKKLQEDCICSVNKVCDDCKQGK